MTNIIKGVPTEARLFGGLYASLYADNHTYRVIVYPQSQIRTVCEDRAELKEYIGVHRKTALIVYIKKGCRCARPIAKNPRLLSRESIA